MTHCALIYAACADKASFGRRWQELTELAAQGDAVSQQVLLPLVQSLWAYNRGNYSEVVRLLADLRPELVRLGGSNAQREVFEETLQAAEHNSAVAVNPKVFQTLTSS